MRIHLWVSRHLRRIITPLRIIFRAALMPLGPGLRQTSAPRNSQDRPLLTDQAAKGRLTMNAVPFLTDDSTRIVPSWARMI